MTRQTNSSAELERRLHQQRIVGEFGVFALRNTDGQALLHEAARIAAEGTDSVLSKMLEYRAAAGDLLVRAGIGWQDGVVGVATLACDEGSPAGFAFKNTEAVMSNDLAGEARFRTPALLRDHGVRAAINVPVMCCGARYGVLEVDSREPDRFTQADKAFLLALANMVSVATERHLAQAEVDRVGALLRVQADELRHRIKNLFTVVYSLVGLSERDGRRAGDPQTAFGILRDRIEALSRASNVGADGQGAAGDAVAVAELTRAVLQAYDGRVEVSGDGVLVPGLWSTPLGLLFYELGTNAVKYGALGHADGRVTVDWSREDGAVTCIWREEDGPVVVEPLRENGSGGRILDAVVQQIDGTLERRWEAAGLVVSLRVPLPQAESAGPDRTR